MGSYNLLAIGKFNLLFPWLIGEVSKGTFLHECTLEIIRVSAWEVSAQLAFRRPGGLRGTPGPGKGFRVWGFEVLGLRVQLQEGLGLRV